MNAVMNLQVPQNVGHFLTSFRLISSLCFLFLLVGWLVGQLVSE